MGAKMSTKLLVIAGGLMLASGQVSIAGPVPEIPKLPPMEIPKMEIPKMEIPSIGDAAKSEIAPIHSVPDPAPQPVQDKPDPRCEKLTPQQRIETPGCN
jgi:hypothetical protein